MTEDVGVASAQDFLPADAIPAEAFFVDPIPANALPADAFFAVSIPADGFFAVPAEAPTSSLQSCGQVSVSGDLSEAVRLRSLGTTYSNTNKSIYYSC